MPIWLQDQAHQHDFESPIESLWLIDQFSISFFFNLQLLELYNTSFFLFSYTVSILKFLLGNSFILIYRAYLSAGMVAALTNESATSKSVYFAHCTSEMIFITHLLTEEPEKLAGPLLADTYVTLLKGRNAWYGQMLAKGELSLDMGDSIKGKGMIQVWLLILECGTLKIIYLIGDNQISSGVDIW